MSRSERDDARHFGVGRVGHQQVDALAAEPREPSQVGEPPVEGQLIHLEVAGVQDYPGRGPDSDGKSVWDRVVNCKKFQFEWSERNVVTLLDLHRLRRQAVLGQLGSHQAQRQPRADQRDVAALAEQVRDRADVVLVGVREHERLDLIQPVLQVTEVGQDEVHARLVRLGKQDTAVDDQQPSVVLEDGHITADLTEPAERDDAQALRGQRRRGAEFRMGVAHWATPECGAPLWQFVAVTFIVSVEHIGMVHYVTGALLAPLVATPLSHGPSARYGSFTPPAIRSSRSWRRSASFAGRSGPRTPPPGRPSRSSAAFVMTAAWLRNSPTLTGSTSW